MRQCVRRRLYLLKISHPRHDRRLCQSRRPTEAQSVRALSRFRVGTDRRGTPGRPSDGEVSRRSRSFTGPRSPDRNRTSPRGLRHDRSATRQRPPRISRNLLHRQPDRSRQSLYFATVHHFHRHNSTLAIRRRQRIGPRRSCGRGRRWARLGRCKHCGKTSARRNRR
jgi:hypothetical protein